VSQRLHLVEFLIDFARVPCHHPAVALSVLCLKGTVDAEFIEYRSPSSDYLQVVDVGTSRHYSPVTMEVEPDHVRVRGNHEGYRFPVTRAVQH